MAQGRGRIGRAGKLGIFGRLNVPLWGPCVAGSFDGRVRVLVFALVPPNWARPRLLSAFCLPRPGTCS